MRTQDHYQFGESRRLPYLKYARGSYSGRCSLSRTSSDLLAVGSAQRKPGRCSRPRSLERMGEPAPTWSIGHSNHELPAFVDLVRGAGIAVIADVRSQPYSRFNPQFNREPLRSSLLESGIDYVFLGAELGGRPAEPECYDSDGNVLYGKVAQTDRFRDGLQRLVSGSQRFRVAMMCSEGDPANCHRHLLIARALTEDGAPVVHVLSDGTTITETELAAQHASQPALFGD